MLKAFSLMILIRMKILCAISPRSMRVQTAMSLYENVRLISACEIVFNVTDVFALLDELDNRYTLTVDGISSIFSKILAVLLALPLCTLFN